MDGRKKGGLCVVGKVRIFADVVCCIYVYMYVCKGNGDDNEESDWIGKLVSGGLSGKRDQVCFALLSFSIF